MNTQRSTIARVIQATQFNNYAVRTLSDLKSPQTVADIQRLAETKRVVLGPRVSRWA